jgi:K+-transporting ATPase ATPase C chain
MKDLKIAVKTFLFFSVLVGLVYPIFITLVAKIVMPYKANGSLLIKDNKVIGSVLIGQSFTEDKYFQSRPSFVGYNAQGSGGSNYGPSNKKFIEEVAEKIKSVRAINGISDSVVPADMVLSSASGLDPHISVENALIQAKRVAQVRRIPLDEILRLVNNNTDKDFLGVWGRPGVNVLKLNITIDELETQYKNRYREPK